MNTMNIYIAIRKYSWEEKPQMVIDDKDMTEIHAAGGNVALYKIIEVREIEVPEMPHHHELVAAEIESLTRAQEEVKKEARRKTRAIEERISDLLSLEYLEGEH